MGAFLDGLLLAIALALGALCLLDLIIPMPPDRESLEGGAS
jgi:hypothetical protein